MKKYRFNPVAMDRFDPCANQPPKGAIVVKTQPYGCPKNGTMGHCFIKPVEGGEFCLVLENSLEEVK